MKIGSISNMLRSCPSHEFKKWLIVETFYVGLLDTTKVMVEASAESVLMNKSVEDAFSLIDDIDMAQNEYQWSDERSPPNVGGM